MPVRTLTILTAICAVWALNVVVSKVVIEQMGVPPLFFAALRALVVMLVLLPWLRPLPKPFWRTAAIALSISGGSFALLFMGLRTASPASSAVVNLIGAPLTVMFAIVFLKEQVGWRRGLGIATTFAGVIVAIASPSSVSAEFGLLLVAASAAIGALGSVALKRIELSAVRIQAWAGASSLVVLMPISLVTESGQIASVVAGGWRFAALLGFSAIIVSVIAHTAYFRILKDHDANVVAPLTLMTPIMTIALGAWLTGDAVGPYLIAGALIALAGVMVIVVRPSVELFKPLLVRGRI